MKTFLGTILTAAALSLPLSASADSVNIGVLLGYTGPIESLTPSMASGAELAMEEVSNSGLLLGGKKVTSVRADSTCVDAAAASAAAERLITSDKVSAIMGADCSGVTIAVLQNVAKPNGIVMISPSATSPALTDIEDKGYFFRTSPSDARQGQVLAKVMLNRGVQSAALTYTNNDYGKGLAESIKQNFESMGGKITISVAHEDGKGDYSAEVAALSQAGGDVLIVAGYLDQGGKGIIQSALDADAFETFVLPDGMVGDSLPKAIGEGLNGSFGTLPSSDGPSAETFASIAKSKGIDNGAYVAQSYDAAALILLSMQAADSMDSRYFKGYVSAVANAPGEKIYPGELAKGLRILATGGSIDYVGATDVELIGPGESAGAFAEILIENESLTTARTH